VITVDLVRRLVAEQHPAWADLPVRPVEQDGWDNRTFRLGDTLTVRLPSAAGYVPQVEKEVRWLPYLASVLPLPVPEVVAPGVPGAGYPFPWTVRRWIEGEPGDPAGLLTAEVVAGLAAFLQVLWDAAPAGGPAPGPHSGGRGAPLRQWDGAVRAAVAEQRGRLDGDAALAVWQRALDADQDDADREGRWFHGDVAPGNLLLRDGRLAAVIDLGLAGVGDPACDLAVAWTSCDAGSREELRAGTGADDAMWLRGQGWALWKALIARDDPRHAAPSGRVLAALGLTGGGRPTDPPQM
jgi:aminoglycoside phosphotransferase (APT) family kinase protein